MRQFEDISELESLKDIHPRDYHKINSDIRITCTYYFVWITYVCVAFHHGL